jgi:hypothetical protein
MRRLTGVPVVLLALLSNPPARAALPEPPEQFVPWQAPEDAGVPDFLPKVAAILFDAGLADPRGGEYREVGIATPGNGNRLLQTHAWLFPGEFAVCWDGLVYRADSKGAAADLEKDIGTVLSSGRWSTRFPFIRARNETERTNAAFWFDLQTNQSIAPVSIALLLRLGRADLAKKLWEAPEDTSGSSAGSHETGEDLWLVTSATAWFGNAYWRLVHAFQAGDDPGALDAAESILQWRSRVPENWRTKIHWVASRVPDISFLDPVPELAADAARRMREPKRAYLDLAAIAAGKSEAAEFFRRPKYSQVQELTDRLEDALGPHLTIPGSPVFWLDPDYALLKKEGDAAVDALIDAYENDKRLTRAFDYSRPWSTAYTPVPVRDVIKMLLTDTLGRTVVPGKSPAELRAWWQQRHSRDRAERNFEMLADDAATPQQWLEAADFLTTRSDLQWTGAGKMSDAGACTPGKKPPPLHGDKLRSRHNPGIGDLILKRTASMVALGSDLACSMSVKAALWDVNTAHTALRQAAGLRPCRANHMVAIARIATGEPGAAADWAAELAHHSGFPPLARAELAPIWMFPKEPVLEKTAESLFGSPDSTWWPEKVYDDIDSPLIAIPAFRRAVLSALDDSSIAGSASRTAQGYLEFRVANGGGGGSEEPENDPRQAPPGEERAIRAKDLVAWEISNLEGAPEFGLDWSAQDKDAAIAALARFLREKGARLRPFPSGLREIDCPFEEVFWEK